MSVFSQLSHRFPIFSFHLLHVYRETVSHVDAHFLNAAEVVLCSLVDEKRKEPRAGHDNVLYARLKVALVSFRDDVVGEWHFSPASS